MLMETAMEITQRKSCSAPSGYVSNASDYDGAGPYIRASESCNSIDDDCDGPSMKM